jgi:hypothetical protein
MILAVSLSIVTGTLSGPVALHGFNLFILGKNNAYTTKVTKARTHHTKKLSKTSEA